MLSIKRCIILALLVTAHSAFAIRVFRIDAVKGGNKGACSAFTLYDRVVMTAKHCFVPGYVHTTSGGIIQNYSHAPGKDLAIFRNDNATGGIDLFRSEDELNQFITTLKNKQGAIKSWGRNSGNMSGTVVATNFEEGRITLSQKHVKGDSGGPVWVGDQLVGLISARNGSGQTIVQLYYDGMVQGW